MIDPAKTIETIQKLAPQTLFAFATASAVVLFAPVGFISSLQLETIREKYGFWTGLVCLASSSLLAMHVAWWVAAKIKSAFDKKQVRKVRREKLRNLTPDEKRFLLPYISDEATTRHADASDGVVNGLEARCIVYRAANVFKLHSVPFNIRPWAREHLRENPELLHGAAKYPPR